MWPSKSQAVAWRTSAILACLLIGLLLTSCVSLQDPEASFDYSGDIVATLKAGYPVGQTFISRRPGLQSMQLWLRKGASDVKDTDNLDVALYHAPGDSKPVATANVSYYLIRRDFPVKISFSTLSDPSGQSYYLQLSTSGGSVSVYGRSEDAYPDGALYVDGQKQDSDLAFRTAYDYGAQAMFGDLGNALRSGWLILPLMLLLWVPGMLALETADAAFGRKGKFLGRWDWSERFGLAVGLSLAIVPLTLLWTSTIGLRLGRVGALVMAVLAALGLIDLRFWRVRRGGGLKPPQAIDLAMLALFGFTLAERLVMVRDLAAPAWVDSIHHATITRLILETGAFPKTYAPYADVSSAVYHLGFHGIAAALIWLSGLELAPALLILGQIMNALIVPAIYLLSSALTRNRLASLLASLAAGLLSLMPAYYVSWGRYTQLAGLLILPACAALLMRLLEEQAFPIQKKTPDEAEMEEDAASKPISRRRRLEGLRLAALAALAGAGLFLVHYRVAGFLGLLMIAYFIGEVLRSLNKQPLWESLPKSIGWVAVAAFPAALISLPWWPGLIHWLLVPRLAIQSGPAQTLMKIDWGYLNPVYGKQMMWLAAAGVLLAVARARWFGPVLALWVGLLFIAANQGPIPIPGGGMINLSSVEIMLFVPIAILAGYLISEAFALLNWAASKLLPVWGSRVVYTALGLAMLAAGVGGAQKQIPTLNPNTLLFRQADLPAMAWIDQNLPLSSTILINPFLWGYGIYAGADGGYWITPLTGRTSMPPNLLYASENKESVERVRRIAKETLDRAGDPAGLAIMLKTEGVDYVYIGRKGGALSPTKLQNSGLFRTVYHAEGVWIFALNK